MECPGEDHKHGEVLQKKRYSDEFARNWFCSTLTDYQRIKVKQRFAYHFIPI